MPAIQPLYLLLEINHSMLSKEEHLFLEADLFRRICEEVKQIFGKQLKEYFYLMNFTIEMEGAMLEANFLRLVINDILSTEEYTLEGIARYTGIHEDVVLEVISGRNSTPSAILLQRALDLHRTVRSDLYREIIKKVASVYSAVA
jgi:hypothetical protein